MRVLVAPGPFKESLGADEVAAAIARGFLLGDPSAQVTRLPLCDGGSGFSQRITEHANGQFVQADARDPLGRPIIATYGLIQLKGELTAVIESACVAGLALLSPDERDPAKTSSAGLGDLISDAVLRRGCTSVLVGCGDSATNDGGAGMAAALGVKFLDSNGAPIGPGGLALLNIHAVDLSRIDPRIKNAKYRVACNVTSILCGPDGTSLIYAPQKGATKELSERLDTALTHYASLVDSVLGVDIRFIPGGGAAGGIGSALYTFFGASLEFSMNVVREFIDLDQSISMHDIVLTGEGCIDRRTSTGKVVACVALAGKKLNKPVIAFCGKIGDGGHACYYMGLDNIVSISDGPRSLESSMTHAAQLVEGAAFRVARSMRISRRMEIETP